MSDSLPETGYPDYRRSVDALSEILVNVDNAASTPEPIYGRFFIGQAPALEILFRANVRAHVLEVSYFPQQVGGFLLGFTNYTIRATTELPIRTAAYGPWVEFQVRPATATVDGTHDLFVETSQRVIGPAVPVSNTSLLYRNAVNVGAGVTDTTQFQVPYTGWAHWHVRTTAAAWIAELLVRDRDNNVQGRLARFDNTVPGGLVNHLLYVPPLILDLTFLNNDGAARTFNTSLVPTFV